MAEDARNILRSIMARFGLDDDALVNEVWNAYTNNRISANADIDTIGVAIADTEAYKRRFAANEILRSQGKPQFTISRYLALEGDYNRVLRNRNMPQGFYDDPTTDFTQMIVNDVSPDELAGRIDEGYRAVAEADPMVVQQFRNLYGVEESELAAYFIDPQRMRPQFDQYQARREAQAAQIAAQAQRQAQMGLTATQAEELVRRGVTVAEAQTGFGAIAQAGGLLEAQQMGEAPVTQAEAVEAFVGRNAAAAQRIATRARRRRAEAEAGGGFATVNQFQTTGLRTVGE